MKFRFLKYGSPVIVYLLAFLSFTHTGFLTWLALIYAWVLIPFTELFLSPQNRNLDAAEEAIAKKDRMYDFVLYGMILLIYPALFFFLHSLAERPAIPDLIGRIATMGLLCGVFGINLGHELGHRSRPGEKLLAKAGLLSSLYLHFFIEHNRGHHKKVATPEDPASARLGESVYHFYARTIIYSYTDAWRIANREQRKKGKTVFGFSNEMIRYQLIELGFLLGIFSFYGLRITCCYLGAAIIGILLLETVNYIEHYGLSRKITATGNYERTLPQHSWNSNHVIGRLMLFELSRHSDHHYLASKKYQLLRHHEDAPQLPTGYPGMMLLALIPPIWFAVMEHRLKKYGFPSRKAIPAF